MDKKNQSQVILVIVVMLIIVLFGYMASKGEKREKTIEDSATTTDAAFPNMVVSTFSDKDHVSFKYPSDWKVAKTTGGVVSYNLQPKDVFKADATSDNILITVTSSCVDSKCTTRKNLSTVMDEMKAIKLGDANASGMPGLKVQFEDFKVGFIFIQGKDVVTIKTDNYLTFMTKVVSTLKLLAVQ